MGAVLGIAAFGRTQEKLGGANNGGITPSTPSFSSSSASFGTSATPAPVSTGVFSAPVTSTPVSGGFGSTAPATPATSKFGKVVPQQEDPVL
jgi:hypothetical protein